MIKILWKNNRVYVSININVNNSIQLLGRRFMSCKRIGSKNGVSIYEIVIENGVNEFGKRTRVKRRFRGTRIDVEKYESELKKKYYHNNKKAKMNSISFKEYSELFIKEYCIPNISKITIRDYETMLKRINNIIGNVNLRDIDAFLLDKMYNIIKKGVKGKELSSKSMLHYYNLISKMFKQAKKWQLIDSNPNENANKPRLSRKHRDFYNVEQTISLLNCLTNESIRNKTLILLTLTTGLRRSEICALRWSDIDFTNKKILIDNSLKVVNGVVDEEKAKTDYSIRYVYINDEMVVLLKKYKDWQDNYIDSLKEKWVGSDRLFISKYGKHMHPDTINKILQKIIKKNGLDKITIHELRHTYSSILNNYGVDPKTISELLGHSNTDITMNIYTHTFEESKIASTNIFSNLIKSSKLGG